MYGPPMLSLESKRMEAAEHDTHVPRAGPTTGSRTPELELLKQGTSEAEGWREHISRVELQPAVPG